MSVNAQNIVWLYYPGGGPMLVLALALADEADDYGAGISASQAHLAKKVRQTERGVQKQLGRLRGMGLIEVVKDGKGRGQPSEYKLNLSALLNQQTHERRSTDPDTNPRTAFDRSRHQPTNGVQGLYDTHIKELKEKRHASSSDVAAFALSVVARPSDDERLARWIYERLRKLNPKHREPSWPAWCKDIRRMRELDKRSHREIAELFAWANGDAFWQANVLCPATLRRQWDRLLLQRGVRNGGVHAPRQCQDQRCSWDKGGTRCEAEGVFGHADGRRFCRKHEEEQERGRDSAQA